MKVLNGHLYKFLYSNAAFARILKVDIIHNDIQEAIEDHRRFIYDIIKEARANNMNWVFSEEDVTEVTINFKDKSWELPSVDIASLLGLGNCNEIKKLLTENDFNEPCGETESSAWYPYFSSKNDAIKCIEILNKLFDDKYLTGK